MEQVPTNRPPVVEVVQPNPRAGDLAEGFEGLAAEFKALGDPVRLRLFMLIAAAADPLCVCNLPDVGVSQPTVSHHLRKLREAGLVDCERRGSWVHYWVTATGNQQVDAISRLAGQGHRGQRSAAPTNGRHSA